MSSDWTARSLSLPEKAILAVRIWAAYLLIRRNVRRVELPLLIERLSRISRPARSRHPARRLSRAVDRSLRIGSRRPTCLVKSLVLFRLLREQGDHAELVIGLPESPTSKDAHAWVELDGREVGPPPGRAGHSQLARFA
jgi:hypothetical protein